MEKSIESPFVESKPFRFNFSLVVLLVLMVIAVGGAMLLLLVMRVPAFTSNFGPHMGKTELVIDPEESRTSPSGLLMYLYASPLGLGMVAYGLHHLLQWLNRATAPARRE
ncbi:MAG: hypothetical protein U0930_02155 [Pirellulales bacterium]